MEQQQDEVQRTRIAELEALVSRLRHDLRGVMTPVSLVSDQLRGHADPAVQRGGQRIGEAVERMLDKLDSTYALVPPAGGKSQGLVLGQRDPGGRKR